GLVTDWRLFCSSRRRHTSFSRDWSSDVCSSDLANSSPEDQERRIQRIVALEPPVLVVADGESPSDKLMAMCGRAGIPLFVTKERSEERRAGKEWGWRRTRVRPAETTGSHCHWRT